MQCATVHKHEEFVVEKCAEKLYLNATPYIIKNAAKNVSFEY